MRVLAGAGFTLLVVFAAAVLWLRYVALPHVETWRPEILGSIEAASGMSVDVKRIQGGWEGLRPRLSMEGFKLSDRKGRAALAFDRAEVTLSWWALLLGGVRFHEADFERPELILRRGADGFIYLADKPLNPAGPGGDGQLARWLLEQPRLQIHNATLVWRDDKAGAPEVRLSNVEIAMRRKGDRHLASLTASPPAYLSGRIEARADVVVERFEDHWRVAGELYGETLQSDIARLREHLPVPATLRSGTGSLRVWSAFGHEGVKEITADLNMRDAKAQLAEDVLPLELASVAGRAVYRAEPQGFYFGTQGLRFRTASGMEAKPGSFSIARRADKGQVPRGEIKADGIDLKIAAALLDYFPVPRDVKGQVVRFAPRGTIQKATLTWTGEGPAKATALDVRGSFEDLAVNAVDGYPGVSGLTGSLEGDEKGGAIRIASKDAALEVQRLFRAPLRFASLEAKAKWKRTGPALEVAIEAARFANADAEGEFAGLWRWTPELKEHSPGWVDLKGTFARIEARGVANYLPNTVEVTRSWLDRAVLAGATTRARFEVKGDMWHFPFAEGREGRFLIEGELRDGRLKYHPEWPAVDAIDGKVRFEGSRMEIHAESAAIYASRMRKTTATIADMGAKPPVVELVGEIDTLGGDAARFLRESPLVNGPGAFTRVVAVEGPGKLNLKLSYPMYGTDPVRVNGEYQFNGATATVGRALVMGGVKGRVAFSEKAVRAPELTGSMFNQPAVVRIASQPDGSVLTNVEGRMGKTALAAYVAGPIAQRLDGSFDWKARLASGKDGSDLVIDSDLKGLAVTLPAPFAKAAADARALAIEIRRLGAPDETTTATLAGGIRGRFATRGAPGAERWQAALHFGPMVESEPMKDGIWLYGELPRVDLDAWLAVFAGHAAGDGAAGSRAAGEAGGAELRGFDLKLGRAVYTQREFRNLGARLERTGTQWKGRLDGEQIAGDVSWNPAGRGRVVARLSRFALLQTERTEPSNPEPDDGGDLPALDIVADKFDFKGTSLGRLELRAEPTDSDWRIERLDIVNGHAQFKSSGAWRRTGTGSLTTLDLKLGTTNLNALFAQFGYGDYVKRGQAKLEGRLAWPGFPNEFGLGNLSGAFKLEAKSGQFAKIEPGAGKLLGLLSLQSIPRRVTFDFRDVFSDGFAFESITSSVRVARGVLLTDDFEINGPAAFVSMAGEVSMPQETQKLTMRVVPEVGESVALAATLIGTPVLGLSTLLVSKLLQNPLGKVVAYEYQVTGSWDNPSVTRISAPPPKAAAAPAKSVTP